MKFISCLSLLTLAAMPVLAQTSDIIKNTPAGTLHSKLYRQSSAFFAGTAVKAFGRSGSYVVSSDKQTYYIYNIFSQYDTDSWVKGTLRGDTIYVETPQHVYKDTDYDLYVNNMKYDETLQNYVVDTDNRAAKFVVSGDTLKQVSPQVLGMTDKDGAYYGYGDRELMMFVNKDQIATPPADLQTERYSLNFKDEYGDSQSKLVKVGFQDDNVWLGELSTRYPNVWIKGTKKNNRITFSSSQYLTYTDARHIYFMTAVVTPAVDPTTGETGESYETSRNIRFNWDGDSYSATDVMFTNQGKNDIQFKECFAQPRLTKFVFTPQTPSNPTIQAYNAYDSSNKYGSLSFTIPQVSITDAALDPDSIFYNIYIDEKKFTFKAYRYSLKEDMTDIPLNYTDGLTFAVSSDDPNTHIVYYKERVGSYYKRIGVQALYKAGGEVRRSDIVYSDGTTVSTGVKAVKASSRAIETRYFDLSGREVKNPAPGVYLKSERHADGTVTTTKTTIK